MEQYNNDKPKTDGPKTLVESAEELGGIVKDVQIVVPEEEQKEEVTFPEDQFITEEVGDTIQARDAKGNILDKYGNILVPGDTEE